jgi:hypothetical protein
MVDRLADTMRFMADNGTLATDFDSVIHNWAVHGLNYYVTARLNWNPYLSADEILDDYCTSGFGEGAAAARRYFLKIQEIAADEKRTYTPEVIRQLRGLLNEADRAAGNDETVRSRIAFLRLGLNFTDLQMTINRVVEQARAKDPAFDPKRARQLLLLNYFVLRDIVRNHHVAINASYLMWGNGDCAAWSPIKGRGFRPEKEVLARVEATKCTLSGREDSIGDMLVALGLDVDVTKSPQ